MMKFEKMNSIKELDDLFYVVNYIIKSLKIFLFKTIDDYIVYMIMI